MPKFIQYTEEQIRILSDPKLFTEQVAKLLGIGKSTVVRARKRLGIVVPKGKKPDTISTKMKPHSRPGKTKKEIRTCKYTKCNNTFEVVPSRTKEYCSHRCHSLTLDNSHLHSPEVLAKRTKTDTPEFTAYKRLVHRLSGKTYSKNIDAINPNGYPRTLCGVEGGWQLDHIMSIRDGFDQKVPAEQLAECSNLRMLPWKTNLMRNYVNRT